jgi:hypothetical protein
MVLRKMRWLAAAVVAITAMVGSPSRSRADTQILIQELNGSTVVSSQITTGTTASFATPNFTNIQVTTNSGSGAIGSLTTNVAANLAGSFDPTHTLQVIVTSDSFTNPFPGQPANVTNTAGASTAIQGGTNTISGSTQILSLPLTNSTTQTGVVASGTVIAGPTTNSTASFNLGSGSTSGAVTTTSNPALPDTYAIQQTINVRATPDSDGSIASGSSAGGTVGSTLVTNAAPVPAPAGLVLALAAIPAFGLRRYLRRRAA